MGGLELEFKEFEEISGKNCTEAGDAYVNIVGKGGNVVGSYE